MYIAYSGRVCGTKGGGNADNLSRLLSFLLRTRPHAASTGMTKRTRLLPTWGSHLEQRQEALIRPPTPTPAFTWTDQRLC
jgi:hypothetical protein